LAKHISRESFEFLDQNQNSACNRRIKHPELTLFGNLENLRTHTSPSDKKKSENPLFPVDAALCSA
jgi:hypothetical protein